MQYAIVYVFDKTYIKYFELSLYTLLLNNNEDNFEIVILYTNIEDIKDIENITKIYKKKIIFKQILYKNYLKNKYAFNPFYRLDLFTLNNYKKIIFLDCDTLIVKNIYSLFLSNISFGACKYNTNSKNDKNYFNAGVLIIDKHYLSDNVYKALLEKMPYYEEEEKLLNNYFKNDVFFIEPKYNCSIFTSNDFNLDSTYIYHFVSYTKQIYNIKQFLKNLYKLKNSVLENKLFLNDFSREYNSKIFLTLYFIVFKVKSQYKSFIKQINK